MGKAFSDVGRGQWHAHVFSLFAGATKFAEDFRQLPGYLVGIVEFKQRFGRHPLEDALVRQGFGDRSLGGALFGAWFFDGSNGGHFKVLGQFGQDGLGLAHPHDQFAAQRPQPGTQVGNALQKEPKPVRSTPREASGVGGQDLTWIENPHPNRRFIDPKQGLVVHTKISPKPEERSHVPF